MPLTLSPGCVQLNVTEPVERHVLTGCVGDVSPVTSGGGVPST